MPALLGAAPWLAGVVAAVGFGSADFLGGVASRRVGARSVVVTGQACGLLLLSAPLAAMRVPVRGPALGLGAGAGVLGAVGLVLLFRALARGAMGVVSAVAAGATAVPVTASLMLGERLSGPRAVGIGLIISGVLLAAHDRRLRGALGQAVLAAVCIGAFLLLMSQAAEHGIGWALVAARFAALPVVLVLGSPLGALRLDRRAFPVVLGMAGCELVADTAFVIGSSAGTLGATAALGALSPLATGLLAWAVLGERLRRHQLLAVCLALAGAALVGVASGT